MFSFKLLCWGLVLILSSVFTLYNMNHLQNG